MIRQKRLAASPLQCRRNEDDSVPTLRLTPTAWAKLLFLRDLGDTEVGGFGITSADDLLLIEDVQLVRQTCSGASVVFDDQAVADYFDWQVDEGRTPQQFGRIWVHTHPGNCAEPSHMDEDTFARAFGRADWTVMFIVARGGQSIARLRFNVGPGGEVDLPVAVDYRQPFTGSDHAAWQVEYHACVEPVQIMPPANRRSVSDPADGDPWDPWGFDEWHDLWDRYDRGFLPAEAEEAAHAS